MVNACISVWYGWANDTDQHSCVFTGFSAGVSILPGRRLRRG